MFIVNFLQMFFNVSAKTAVPTFTPADASGFGTNFDDNGFLSQIITTIIALFIVILLIYIILKIVLPKIYGAGQFRFGRIRIMESKRLEPRKNLHIIRIGEEEMLIGTSEQNISVLSRWEMEEENIEDSPGASVTSLDEPGSGFSRIFNKLKSEQRKKENE